MKNVYCTTRDLEVEFAGEVSGVSAEVEYTYTIEKWTDGAGERRYSVYVKFHNVVEYTTPADVAYYCNTRELRRQFADAVIKAAQSAYVDHIEKAIASDI